ncbi:Kae1-associated serine/threonine protein kinase [Candidatus Woesearchaeota archaeon]|nr:Kae1-associated serine/threonine protein kinase [Candidatus Woesearchaeota archaeon]
MKKIAQGAEARIYLTDSRIIKDRIEKKYRIKEIDERIRRSRTKREAKVFERLALIGFPAPRMISTDRKEKITMELIKGPKVRDVLEDRDHRKLSEEIGRKIAVLHDNGIIHGDLTTSNMIIGDEIFFIDFGLSFFSHKAEDKAVDLHLLKQALESKHYTIWEKCFKAALNGYTDESKDGPLVVKRLEAVEKRGRYKGKRGKG